MWKSRAQILHTDDNHLRPVLADELHESTQVVPLEAVVRLATLLFASVSLQRLADVRQADVIEQLTVAVDDDCVAGLVSGRMFALCMKSTRYFYRSDEYVIAQVIAPIDALTPIGALSSAYSLFGGWYGRMNTQRMKKL